MAEQIIDIRQRIEKMRIKFEDDNRSGIDEHSKHEKKDTIEQKGEIRNPVDKVNSFQKDNIKSNENNELPKAEISNKSSKEFPSVQLSVKNPISSKVLVFLMVLQVFSNIGIFMLLLNVLE